MTSSSSYAVSSSAHMRGAHAPSHIAHGKDAKGSAFAAMMDETHGKSGAADDAVPAPDKKSEAAKPSYTTDKAKSADRTDDSTRTADTARADKSDKTDKADKAEDAGKDASADQTSPDAPTPQLVQTPPPAPPIPVALSLTAGADTDGEDSDAAPADAVAAAQPQTSQPAAPQDIIKIAQQAKPPQTDSAAAKPDSAQSPAHEAIKTARNETQADDARPAQAHGANEAPAPQPAQTAPSAPLHQAALTAPVQPMPVADNTAPNTHVTASVDVAPEHKPNLNSLAVEISAKSQNGAKQFDIRLDPPELGRVEVRLSIDATGKASAHLTADQPQTLDLLQKDSTSLTRALRDAGLDVAQDGLNFSLRNQNGQNNGNKDGARGRGPSIALTATKTIDAAQPRAAFRSSAGDARLDIHV